MTTAYTVVIQGPSGTRAVYWNGEPAYTVGPDVEPEQAKAFAEDLAASRTVDCAQAVKRYGAKIVPCA